MDALSYEDLIRNAYNCERGGANGKAEAEVYRKMERVENAINTRISIDSNGDLEYNYRSASIHLSMNIHEALMKVADDFYFTDENNKFKEHLEKLASDIYVY